MAEPNSIPRFTRTPWVKRAKVTAANTNLDGTGAIVKLLTAGESGSAINYFRAVGTGAVTTGQVRFFIDIPGDNYGLSPWDEELIATVTPGASTRLPIYEWMPTEPPLDLQPFATLYVSTDNAETYWIYAVGGDY